MSLLGRTNDDSLAQADSKAMDSSTLPNTGLVAEMPLRPAMNGASLGHWVEPEIVPVVDDTERHSIEAKWLPDHEAGSCSLFACGHHP